MIVAAHRFPGAFIFEHDNWGFPFKGSARRIRPPVRGVSHITGNSQLPSALAEAQFSGRSGSGASFTFAVNRNGTVVQCMDPWVSAPWTNGDLKEPQVFNEFVRDMVGSPFNANEHCHITIENVGFGPANPLTAAQIETDAQIYAWAAALDHLKVIDPATILGHRMINTVTRWNCPTSGDLTILRRQIARRANAILAAGAAQEEDPVVIAELRDQVESLQGMLATCRARSGDLRAALTEAEASLDPLLAELADTSGDLVIQIEKARRANARIREIKATIAAAAAAVATG